MRETSVIVRLAQDDFGKRGWAIRMRGDQWRVIHEGVTRACGGGEQAHYSRHAASQFAAGLRRAFPPGGSHADAAVINELALMFDAGAVKVEQAIGTAYDQGATGRAPEPDRPPVDGSHYPPGHQKHYTLAQFMMRRLPDEAPAEAAAKPTAPSGKPQPARRKKRRVKSA